MLVKAANKMRRAEPPAPPPAPTTTDKLLTRFATCSKTSSIEAITPPTRLLRHRTALPRGSSVNAQDLLQSITRQSREEPDPGIISCRQSRLWAPEKSSSLAGEGNVATPEEFCRPAIDSLLKGETFYTWQRGIPELRAALARYHTRHYGQEFSAENFFVTGGGMQAIQTIIQMIAGEGDEIILPTPAWPNYAGPLRLQGSAPREVPMEFANGKWRLDLDRLFDAITPRTRAIMINSPSNPVGGRQAWRN